MKSGTGRRNNKAEINWAKMQRSQKIEEDSVKSSNQLQQATTHCVVRLDPTGLPKDLLRLF